MALQTDRSLHFEVEVLGMEDDPAARQASWIERGMWPASSTRARDVEKRPLPASMWVDGVGGDRHDLQ